MKRKSKYKLGEVLKVKPGTIYGFCICEEMINFDKYKKEYLNIVGKWTYSKLTNMTEKLIDEYKNDYKDFIPEHFLNKINNTCLFSICNGKIFIEILANAKLKIIEVRETLTGWFYLVSVNDEKVLLDEFKLIRMIEEI